MGILSSALSALWNWAAFAMQLVWWVLLVVIISAPLVGLTLSWLDTPGVYDNYLTDKVFVRWGSLGGLLQDFGFRGLSPKLYELKAWIVYSHYIIPIWVSFLWVNKCRLVIDGFNFNLGGALASANPFGGRGRGREAMA